MRPPRVIQVIETEVRRGTGTDIDPLRLVLQYHTLVGEFLAEAFDTYDQPGARTTIRDPKLAESGQ